MPMGMKNFPMTFQRMIDKVLEGIKGKYAHGYVDNLIVFSKTWTEHVEHVREVLRRLNEANVKIGLGKGVWAMTKVKFLGHMVSHNKIEIDPDKLQGITQML